VLLLASCSYYADAKACYNYEVAAQLRQACRLYDAGTIRGAGLRMD